jgi:hypothetical protein
MLLIVSEKRIEFGPTIAATAIYGLHVAFFAYLIKIANQLRDQVDGTYRRARWMAILAASIFFPIMTIPGILAVRRLERYRSHELVPSRDLT